MVTINSVLKRACCLLGSVPRRLYPPVLLCNGEAAPPLVLASVYRHRNGRNIRRLIDGAALEREAIALWALDEPHPDLADYTVGVGPGGRFDLLQTCVRSLNLEPNAWCVIADDDVTVPAGGLRKAVEI